MKKSLLGLLLAVALVVPAFATDKGAMEVVGKIGVIVEPLFMETTTSGYSNGDKCGYTQEPAFSIGAEGYYYVMNNLGVGLGVTNVFESKFNDGWGDGAKLGATNVYATVKPILAENGLVDKVYFIGQIGVGFNRYKSAKGKEYEWDHTGLYWGLGFGVEKYNVILELLYSVNNIGEFSTSRWYSGYYYTARRLAINLGYKFSL